MGKIFQDVKFALRQIMKAPAFAVTVILTLALGIGANTAIFTLVHAVLLKSLPVANPAQLYRIGDTDNCCVNGGFVSSAGDFDIFSYDLYKHLMAAAPEFESLAAMQSGSNTMNVRRGSGTAKPLVSEYVSGNYFSTFGISPFAGRLMSASDDVPNAPPVAVLSYQSWQADYSSDSSIIGSTVTVQGEPVTIVGVSPPGFFGDRVSGGSPAFWLPVSAEPLIERENSILHHPSTNWLYAVGRVRPGTNIAALQEKLSASLRQFLSSVPDYTQNGGNTVIPKQHVVISPGGGGIQSMQQQTGKGLYLLMAISLLVLLIACANIANLLLARGTARRSDTSLRLALGASRKRLIQQTLTESILLGCVGGFAGLAIAYGGARMILALAFPDAHNLPIQATPSVPILAFAFGLSMVTGIVFGIAPAWIGSHAEPAEALRGVNRSTRDRSSLPQKSLIVFQAALSLVLLAGAGLLTQSLRNLEHQSFGITTANRFVVHLDPYGAGYSPERLPGLYTQMEQRFGALPGVKNVGLALYSALEGNNWGECVFIEGRPAPGPNSQCGSSWDRVSPQFLSTIGQPVLRGRGITEQDTATSRYIAVVNQAFVKKFFPNEDSIGKHFGNDGQQYSDSFEIVGIVADAKYNNPNDAFRPMFLRPLTQRLSNYKEPESITGESRSMYINSITLQMNGPQQDLESVVRHTLSEIDPNLTIIDFHSLDYQVAGNFNQERLVARLTALFGLLALLLASVGLYGVTSYSVARRTSEIGVRMALGATRTGVVSMVLRVALIQIGIGLLIGVPITLIGGRLISSQLYNVRTYDPLALGGAIVVLSICAVVAGFIPARRAASIEPMQALRSE
jgi:predicted permease